MSKLQYIFVHGLSGWGSYDEKYRKQPYWGMKNGDVVSALREKGYNAYAASVAPTGSAWDRTCELYAQLAGTIVDYGKAHSGKNNHERFGKDFSSCPLIKEWNDDTRLVLIGHSFGGATIRLLSELLARGSEEERNVTNPDALSPLFKGGMDNRIHAIVALAAPMNGTTAYDMLEDPSFDANKVKSSLSSKLLSHLMSMFIKAETDGRDERDYAAYDMHIDNALAMNNRIHILPHVYYFSIPCSATRKKDGIYMPVKDRMEPLFIRRSTQMGQYKGQTKGGFVVDETWQENDGLVNTISAKYPLNDPHKQFTQDNVEKGIWNVFPPYPYDHMSMQGGLTKNHPIEEFYFELVSIIDKTAS